MGATPNFNANDESGLKTGSGNTGTPNTNSYTDDISFNRGGTTNPSTSSPGTDLSGTPSTLDSSMSKAHDAVNQLQQKASEITARFVDNVNVDEITQKLEAQVREHPARTLLLAACAGFFLGRTVVKHK